jgi:cytochrome c oxidase subunit 2
VVAVAALVAACGEERDATRPMTEGEQIALDSGCTACHGSNGEGGAGPAWKGLAGSQVELADGSTVTADDAYLTESIRDPHAKSVKGYGAMPPNSLSDDEIAAIVEFIKSLEK